MRALVTGSSGRLGSAFATRLKADGHDVTGCDLRPGPHTEILASFGSVLDRYGVKDAVVFHFAGNPDQDAPWAEVVGPNLTETIAFLAACCERRARAVVLASSGWVRMDPGRPYAAIKTALEVVASAFAAHGDTQVLVDRIGSFDGLDDNRENPLHVNTDRLYRRVTGQIGPARPRFLQAKGTI